jgi:hypothetical protein
MRPQPQEGDEDPGKAAQRLLAALDEGFLGHLPIDKRLALHRPVSDLLRLFFRRVATRTREALAAEATQVNPFEPDHLSVLAVKDKTARAVKSFDIEKHMGYRND